MGFLIFVNLYVLLGCLLYKKKKEENFKWNMLLFIIFIKFSDIVNNYIIDIFLFWNFRLLRVVLFCEEFCEDIFLGIFCKI